MTKKTKTFPLGRDSETGQFIPVDEARRHKKDSTVERIPKKGYGDTRKSK